MARRKKSRSKGYRRNDGMDRTALIAGGALMAFLIIKHLVTGKSAVQS